MTDHNTDTRVDVDALTNEVKQLRHVLALLVRETGDNGMFHYKPPHDPAGWACPVCSWAGSTGDKPIHDKGCAFEQALAALEGGDDA